ncbi:MAG: hypothetical protein M3Y50_06440 [Acidobacteriota bacterium]|nr:hypothetical protein [Acidobacteriota bacterium]
MEILPKSLGTRPRLAIEIRAEGVVAARADDRTALLTSVARVDLAEGVVVPGLRAGNVVEKAPVVAAVREVLDAIAGRGGERGGRLRDVTVVVPDSAARVLFLDFDQLPSKATEALPVVRFRLKKLLPFDADEAVVSYQMMGSEKDVVKLLVVAMPKALVEEYEGVALAAGYLPGAVLPSTLAALAGLEETEDAVLVVNAGLGVVTTAIVQAGVLLLHRSVDMSQDTTGVSDVQVPIPLVDRESTAGEWARQEPLGAEGWSGLDARPSVQATDGPAPVASATQIEVAREMEMQAAAREVAQAVSVAAAYFEDTLQAAPSELRVCGALGAEALGAMMDESGFTGLRVREIVDTGMMEAGAVTASVPRGWLAGVRGALRN